MMTSRHFRFVPSGLQAVLKGPAGSLRGCGLCAVRGRCGSVKLAGKVEELPWFAGGEGRRALRVRALPGEGRRAPRVRWGSLG